MAFIVFHLISCSSSFGSSHAKEMENKQFWKVLYEHLERAAAYAGKSQLLNVIMTVTQLIVNDRTVVLYALNLYVMGELITMALNYQHYVQGRNGEAWKKTVCPSVLNSKKQIEKAPALQEGVVGFGKACSNFIPA